MKDMAKKVLGHIIWLSEESQKADSAISVGKREGNKKGEVIEQSWEKSDTVYTVGRRFSIEIRHVLRLRSQNIVFILFRTSNLHVCIYLYPY
jgi:hypothetical protein